MSTRQKTAIGFIGLGAMGLGMARVLVSKGFPVHGHDINPRAMEALVEAGGFASRSPAEAAGEAAILLLMVVNAQQAEEVLFGPGGAAAALPAGAVVMLCSTVKPEFARSMAARLAAAGIDMLDAPVSGGVGRAADGTLSIMAAGSPSVFAQCEGVMSALARKVYRIGPTCGQGSMMKTVNQLLAGVHLAAAAEAMALGTRAGIDPQRVFEIISHSAGTSWMFEDRVPRMLAGDYTPPKSAVEIFIKDLGIVLDTGNGLAFPLPLTATAKQLFVMAAAAGHGRLDDAAVVKVYEHLADITVARQPDRAQAL